MGETRFFNHLAAARSHFNSGVSALRGAAGGIRPNAISRILASEAIAQTSLGTPSADAAAQERRRAAMFNMTGGRGFRQEPKGPKLSKGGTTRREREANIRAIYARNLAAEAAFRAAKQGQPGWGTAAIRNAIERREHLA